LLLAGAIAIAYGIPVKACSAALLGPLVEASVTIANAPTADSSAFV
jgi:hypothetical protein